MTFVDTNTGSSGAKPARATRKAQPRKSASKPKAGKAKATKSRGNTRGR